MSCSLNSLKEMWDYIGEHSRAYEGGDSRRLDYGSKVGSSFFLASLMATLRFFFLGLCGFLRSINMIYPYEVLGLLCTLDQPKKP